MTIISDFKGRKYQLIEQRIYTTLLQCITTHDLITIPANNWSRVGFIKP